MEPIVTARLRLDPLTADDVEALHALTGDATLMRFISGRANSREETRARLAKDLGYHRDHGFGLCLCRWHETGEVIGRCGIIPHQTARGLEGELAWLFAERWWGRGLATEAAEALVAVGRDHLGLVRLFAQAHPANVR